MRREKVDDVLCGCSEGERGESCRSRSARFAELENSEFKPTGFRPDELDDAAAWWFEFECDEEEEGGSLERNRRAEDDAGADKVKEELDADLEPSSSPLLAPSPLAPCSGEGK